LTSVVAVMITLPASFKSTIMLDRPISHRFCFPSLSTSCQTRPPIEPNGNPSRGGVGVLVGVTIHITSGVAVSVGVAIGVHVGVLVGVTAGVLIGIIFAVGVLVAVGVGAKVGV
jgi:hypothetical protein